MITIFTNILLLMISSNFFEIYSILIIILMILLSTYIYIKHKKIIPLNIESLFLIIFSLSYTLISIKYTNKIDIIILIIPFFSYCCGYMLAYIFKKDKIEKYILLIVFGLFIHAMLNYITNFNTFTRNTVDIWLKVNYAATLQGTMIVLMMSLLYYVIFYVKRFYLKLIIYICILFALLYDLVLATRTTLIISIATFLLCYIYDSISKKKINNMIKKFSIVIFIIFIFFTIYVTNLFNVKNMLENSNLFNRFSDEYTEVSDYSRINTQIMILGQIFEYPLGGNKMHLGELKYAHNMFLDISNAVGLIPFVSIIIYYIINIKKLLKILRNNKYEKKLKILLLSIYFATLANFMVEPIIQGIPLFFILFCVINGMTSNLEKENRGLKEKENENTLDS